MKMDLSTLRSLVTRVTAGERTILDRPDLRDSAVLLTIVETDGEPGLVFTRRTMTVAKHKGQISLPGGMMEPDDDGPISTALRESKEEIGLDPDRVEVVGLLDDSITTTGFVITPVVGFVEGALSYQTQPEEVAEVFEVPLSTLMNPAKHMMQVLEHRGQRFKDHRYFAGTRVIWGATGRIIHSFLSALQEQM